jgi:hypothetical protein
MGRLAVGDRIAYSARFLKSIGAQTGELPQLRGEIRGFKKMGAKTLVDIVWDDGSDSRALVGNIAKVGANLAFCDVDYCPEKYHRTGGRD